MSRHRILRRVREALEERERVEHPGRFEGWREPATEGSPPDAVTAFEESFRTNGGEIVRTASREEARARLAELIDDAAGISVGSGVPDTLLPERSRLEAADAPVGVSMARGAVAETGSLLLDARDGRRVQLLPPVHVVVVRAETVRGTLLEALDALRSDLPSALALHSGPSKSADIGQILVQGVHGPGRVVALVLAEDSGRKEAEPGG
jgi:L-lactate dehydrogenase complex protein LldG